MSLLPLLHLFVRYYGFLCLLGCNQCQKINFSIKGPFFFFFLLCKGNLYDYPMKCICVIFYLINYFNQNTIESFPKSTKVFEGGKKAVSDMACLFTQTVCSCSKVPYMYLHDNCMMLHNVNSLHKVYKKDN